MTWRSVMLIWLLALPFLGGVGYLEWRKDPKPFYQAAAFCVKSANQGVKAVKDYQAKEAAKKAAEAKAKKAAEEKAKKDAASQQNFYEACRSVPRPSGSG